MALNESCYDESSEVVVEMQLLANYCEKQKESVWFAHIQTTLCKIVSSNLKVVIYIYIK